MGQTQAFGLRTLALGFAIVNREQGIKGQRPKAKSQNV
jgi:hypothetical protein